MRNVEEFSSVGSTDWMRKCNNKRNKFNEMEQNCNYLLRTVYVKGTGFNGNGKFPCVKRKKT
jgi:hypothetical protein